MAAWGLLQGFGRGLSQSAEFLSRGMQEDRAVERERLREESIAKRWARQEAAQASAAQQAQSNWQKSYSLQERQLSAAEEARRAARIEETLNRIQSKYSREGEQIDRRYERLLDKAETPEEKQALYEQRDREHEALSGKLEGEMLPALKSFGDGLKGTAYASYIDVLASMDKQPVQPQESSNPVQTTQPTSFDRAGAAGAALGGQTPAADKPKPVQPGLLNPGLLSGFKSGLAGSNNPMPVDYSSITPIQRATTAVGKAAGYFPGGLLDGAEYINQSVVQPAWNWANTPSNQSRK